MSAFGTKRTCRSQHRMSPFAAKADIATDPTRGGTADCGQYRQFFLERPLDLNQFKRPCTNNNLSAWRRAARRAVMHDKAKPRFRWRIAISFVSCVFAFLGQSTRP